MISKFNSDLNSTSNEYNKFYLIRSAYPSVVPSVTPFNTDIIRSK